MPSSLSWRVPTSGDPRLLRLALAQVGLASIVAALVLVFAAPRDWLVPGLVGLIPLAVVMAFRRWNAYRRSLSGSDNVRIDSAGVHWIDGAGQEQSFARDQISGFRIGRDDETLRPVPALTLHLLGGFESQPIELHPPATSEAVRALLGGAWRLVECESTVSRRADREYDAAAFVYGECHDDFHEWHWEGTRDELRRFFSLFAAAASELPLPPPGAKPLERILLASRRQPLRLRVAHAAAPQFWPETIAAPAGLLRQIAAHAEAALGDETASDVNFDVVLGLANRWTFHLHVRPD